MRPQSRLASPLPAIAYLASLAASCTPATLHGPSVAAPTHTDSADATPLCARGQPGAALPALSHADLIERLGTGLDSERRTGGLWVATLPLFVNEPFNFGIAMSLPDIGPAVAAGKRKQANEAKAKALTDVTLDEDVLQQFAALRACGVHAYALLWGPMDDATLSLVVDAFVQEGAGWRRQQPEVVELGARPVAGKQGAWTSAALNESLRAAL